MIDIDLAKLAIVTIFSFAIAFAGFRFMKSPSTKFIVLLFVSGFYLYNFISIADVNVPSYLIVSGIAFIVSAILSIYCSSLIFRPLSVRLRQNDSYIHERLTNSNILLYFTLAYFGVKLMLLVAPEFKLHLLFSPPPPSIGEAFRASVSRAQTSSGSIEYILGFISVQLMPLFYIYLYKVRKNAVLVLLLIAFSAYLDYIANFYIGRYEIAALLFIYIYYMWHQFPKARRVIIFSCVVFTPALLYAANIYSKVRLGVGLDLAMASMDGGILSGAWRTIESEAILLKQFGLPIINSGESINFYRYFMWISTIFVPAVFKSGIDFSLINIEISELVTGSHRSSSSFYVILPGLLSESYYIFGGHFYWMHAVFLGIFIGFLSSVISSVRFFFFLNAYLSVSVALILQRGGISSFFPLFTNGFTLLIVLSAVFWLQYRKHHVSITPRHDHGSQ